MRHRKKLRQGFLAALLAAGVSPAAAADFGQANPAPTTPASKPATDTISFELTPEWSAAGTSQGNLADIVGKLGWSHSLGQGWSWGASVAEQFRPNGINQTALETTLGYGGIKLNDVISLPVSVGVGYVWDGTNASSALLVMNWGYYLFSAGVNVKFDAHWTWNAISARYRDAFQGGWATPKVSTGVTYSIDSRNAVYANVGYGWKTGANGAPPTAVAPDKISASFGFRYGF